MLRRQNPSAKFEARASNFSGVLGHEFGYVMRKAARGAVFVAEFKHHSEKSETDRAERRLDVSTDVDKQSADQETDHEHCHSKPQYRTLTLIGNCIRKYRI